MYYENFWTSFAPSYEKEKGLNWSVGFPPDVPIFSFSAADIGGLVVPAFREPEKYTGVKIKTVVEYLSPCDLATQFSDTVSSSRRPATRTILQPSSCTSRGST
ncbi:hypothetical protein C8Q78DRAFT_1062753 [Trametes maxima]|nr:hypothetical protein C8Q78DRAFT_1062753 [Trametes maxima]